jgi:hypothetical protein
MFSYENMPVVRDRDGNPVSNNVRLINRSDVIRRILKDHGLDTSNDVVHDKLIAEGLRVSDSLISTQRRRLKEQLLAASAA